MRSAWNIRVFRKLYQINFGHCEVQKLLFISTAITGVDIQLSCLFGWRAARWSYGLPVCVTCVIRRVCKYCLPNSHSLNRQRGGYWHWPNRLIELLIRTCTQNRVFNTTTCWYILQKAAFQGAWSCQQSSLFPKSEIQTVMVCVLNIMLNKHCWFTCRRLWAANAGEQKAIGRSTCASFEWNRLNLLLNFILCSSTFSKRRYPINLVDLLASYLLPVPAFCIRCPNICFLKCSLQRVFISKCAHRELFKALF